MRTISRFLVILLASGLSAGACFALTVDEIIRLEQAGVADSTIEMLVKRGGDARSAGVWKQDGWIVHSTPSRESRHDFEVGHGAYPLYIHPRVVVGRR